MEACTLPGAEELANHGVRFQVSSKREGFEPPAFVDSEELALSSTVPHNGGGTVSMLGIFRQHARASAGGSMRNPSKEGFPRS